MRAWRWRKLDDEGKLWPFDPAASFTLEAMLAPGGTAEAEFIVGRADNAVWAGELVARRHGIAPMAEADLDRRFYETRAVEPSPALPTRWPFGFSGDGKALSLSHRTPRPWSQVMANQLGMATMVSNDGEIFSAFANARQNALTAFRFESATTCCPGKSSMCATSTAAKAMRQASRRSSVRTGLSRRPTSRALRISRNGAAT